MPRDPVVAYGLTGPQIEGLTAEQVSRYLGDEKRGRVFQMPTHIYVKRLRAWKTGVRVAQAFAKWEPIMRRVFNALELRRTFLRGAVQSVNKPNNHHPFECDLRLRYRGRLVLTSLKTSRHLKKAEGYHPPGSRVLGNYHRAAEGGTWVGPHPQRGKFSHARYVGTLSVSPNAWRFTIYRRMQLAAYMCFEGEVRPSGGARLAAAKAKAKAAPKAKAKAAPAPAPGVFLPPPAGVIPHDPLSDDSDTSSASSV